MIECKTYTLAEFKKILSITKWQWEERKDDLLDWLKIFFNYEIVPNGRSYNFIIKEQYCEYEPLPRKSKVPEMRAFYENEADHILQYKPRNTGANIAREINTYNNKYEHAEGTIANYIRPYLKANYSISDKEWCYIDYEAYTYNIINAEQLKYLKEQFEKYLSSSTTADIIADVEAGYLTKDEGYSNLKRHYNDAISAFKEKYGFRPYKAGELHKCAF